MPPKIYNLASDAIIFISIPTKACEITNNVIVKRFGTISMLSD